MKLFNSRRFLSMAALSLLTCVQLAQAAKDLDPRIVAIVGSDQSPDAKRAAIQALGSTAPLEHRKMGLALVEASVQDVKLREARIAAEKSLEEQALAVERNSASLRIAQETFSKRDQEYQRAKSAITAKSDPTNEDYARLRQLGIARREARQAVEKIEGGFKKAHTEKEKADQEVEKYQSQFNELPDQVKRDVEKLRGEMDTMKLEDKIEDLQAKIQDADVRAELLESKYDNRIMGQYIKQKMQGLMASDEMCGAVAQCKDGKNQKGGGVGSSNYLDKLFFGSSNTKGGAPSAGAAPESAQPQANHK